MLKLVSKKKYQFLNSTDCVDFNVRGCFLRSVLYSIKMLSTFLSFVGTITVLILCFRVLKALYIHLLRPSTDLRKYGAGSGAWAVVTGASDGIGKGFATTLAKKGFNIVLVSRSQEKLSAVAKELEKKFSIETMVIAVDASLQNAAATTFEALKPLSNIRILVNNVGVGTDVPCVLEEVDEKDISRLIAVNVSYFTEITALMIPLLKMQKKPCAIFNLSSFSATIPSPYLSVYSATKAYNDQMSQNLSSELRPFKIDVMSLRPYYVASAMTGMRRTTTTIISPETLAQDALRKIGAIDAGAPYWSHEIITFAMSLLPRSLAGDLILKQMKVVRRKLLRRRGQDKKG